MSQSEDVHGSGNENAKAAREAAVTESLAGRRVLVVDDSRTARRSLVGYLESAGAEVSVANDGFDALAQLVEVSPQVLVADIVMPRLDGYHLCALVRHNSQFRNLPILLLSSRDGLFDRARASAVGADHHLAKPFDRDTVVSTVADLLGADRARELDNP